MSARSTSTAASGWPVSVLRVETTINNPREFRIQRFVTDSSGRRRYLDALAAAPLKGEGVAALDALRRPRTHRGRRYARFSTLNANDLALFRAALAGEHAIRGFRNSDITKRLYRRRPADRDKARRQCERTSRLIVKLRGHGLVAKIPRARRYRVTRYGHRVMTAAIALHDDNFADHYRAA
jgi:hypothetical protein